MYARRITIVSLVTVLFALTTARIVAEVGSSRAAQAEFSLSCAFGGPECRPR